MIDFIAFDFENGSSDALTACSLGFVVVKNRVIIEKREYLIKPIHKNFNPYSIHLHHISPKVAKNGAKFNKIWKEISHLFKSYPLVAHDALHDIRILRSLLEYYKIPLPKIEYYCSLKMSQKVWPNEEKHKLDSLSKMLGLTHVHHNGLEDSIACAEIVIKMMELKNSTDLHKFNKSLHLKKCFLQKTSLKKHILESKKTSPTVTSFFKRFLTKK